MARPTKYRPEYNEQVYILKRDGKSDIDVAAFFKFSVSTLNLWKLEHSEFSEFYKKGVAEKEAHDVVQVKSALLKRALGVTLKEVRIEEGDDGKPSKTITTTKEVAPDTTACAIYLNNKAPDEFKPRKAAEDLSNVELATPIKSTFEVRPAVDDVEVTRGVK